MRLTHPFQPSHHSSPHDTLRPALTPRRSAPEAWADVTTILPLRTTSQTHATMNSRTRQSAGGSSRRRADTRGPCRRASGCRGGSGRPDARARTSPARLTTAPAQLTSTPERRMASLARRTASARETESPGHHDCDDRDCPLAYPLRDSNPRRRRERPVSWAAKRRGRCHVRGRRSAAEYSLGHHAPGG